MNFYFVEDIEKFPRLVGVAEVILYSLSGPHLLCIRATRACALLPSNRVTGGVVTTSLRLHQKDEERPGEGGEDVGEGGEDLPGGWHVLDEERLQHHVGEALVLEAGEQAGLLEHVGRHHCGGQQSQVWPVVLRVGDDVLEGVG